MVSASRTQPDTMTPTNTRMASTDSTWSVCFTTEDYEDTTTYSHSYSCPTDYLTDEEEKRIQKELFRLRNELSSKDNVDCLSRKMVGGPVKKKQPMFRNYYIAMKR